MGRRLNPPIRHSGGVRTLRDLVATGTTVDQKEFRQLLDEYIAAAAKAQVAMRKDLGISWKRDQ